jgi:hypothetical protein
MSHITQKYGALTVVSLLNSEGYEAPLSNTFKERVLGLNDPKLKYDFVFTEILRIIITYSPYRYIHYDFHKEAGAFSWHNLQNIIDAIQDQIASFG